MLRQQPAREIDALCSPPENVAGGRLTAFGTLKRRASLLRASACSRGTIS